jgi:hypothetical protein
VPARISSVESEPLSNGWRVVRNLDGYGLAQKIREAGLIFVRMAGEFKATAMGFDKQETPWRAVKRALAKLKSQRFNCLEITALTVKHPLGLLYVNVNARPRYIQESSSFSRAGNPAVRGRAKLAIA